jgi:hypothetical protein
LEVFSFRVFHVFALPFSIMAPGSRAGNALPEISYFVHKMGKAAGLAKRGRRLAAIISVFGGVS